MTTNEKQPPPSLEELLGLLLEVRSEVSRVASATAISASYTGRSVKAMETGQSVSSRALTTAAERIERATSGTSRVLSKMERLLDRAAAEPSMTAVRDVPKAIEPEKSDRRGDITGVWALGKRIPSNWVIRSAALLMVAMFILGLVLGRFTGVQPKTVFKYVSPALGVP